MATAHMCLWLWPLSCEGIQISQNPGRAYYVCPRPVQCGNWIGWCDESGTRIPNHDSGSTDVMQLRADVVNIFNTLRVMKMVICVLCIIVIILLLRM